MEKKLKMPAFFSSASRVIIPFVGDDTRQIKHTVSNFSPLSNPLEPHQKRFRNRLLSQISHDLEFDIDVVKERSAHTLPFDEKETVKVFDFSDIIPKTPKKLSSGGRFDTRGFCKKIPTQFKVMSSPRPSHSKNKPRNVTERLSYNPSLLDSGIGFKQDKENVGLNVLKKKINFQQKENQEVDKVVNNTTYIRKSPWDEFVLDQLSKDTAHWIVSENIDPGYQKERLNELLKQKYGTKFNATNLIREDGKEDDDFAVIEKKKAFKLKEEEKQLKQIQKKEKIHQIQNDPVLSQTFAQYYKLPQYLKQKRSKPKDLSRVNLTAHNIIVKHFEPPPPPKMEDFLNPAAGNYVFATKNAFEQQLYTNQAKPMHQPSGDKSRIIMDDLSEYQCHLQSVYPPSHANWSGGNGKMSQPFSRRDRPLKGMQRWRDLPYPADFTSELGLNFTRCETSKSEILKLSKQASRLENAPMIHIIEEWRSKWRLAGQWQEVTLADVLLDMDSLHASVRLGAVATCALAALHKLPVQKVTVMVTLPKINSSVLSNKTDVGHLFIELLVKVREKLEDDAERVRLAAAMCLYTLSECSSRVLEILEYNLEHGIATDRMACAQCLALKGNTGSKVVYLIMQMLLETGQQDQATALLIHLSQYTRLVHSLLAERLNSCCWKDKVIACDVLSELSGNINRDIVHKLSSLMWEDWSSEVRNAAARTLGRTGHGRDVHFNLREKLVRGNERVCVDVLQKIAHLGIMTATLLPEFLKCFNAEYVSVRLEAVKTATALKIHEEKVTSELLRLTEFDPSWKIKAYAIKAIGEIGLMSKKIEKALVWAFRFESEPGIRLEACVSIRKLNINNPDVLLVLQDRVLVEPDHIVKLEIKNTLIAFGMDGPEDNMEMVRQIKSEVRKLSKKSVIAAKIVLYEKELDKFERKAQYIGHVSDDNFTESEIEDDDAIDFEITQALKRPKSTGRNSLNAVLTPSEAVTPHITITPGTPMPGRPFTADTRNDDAPILINNNSLHETPPVDESKEKLLPAVVCS